MYKLFLAWRYLTSRKIMYFCIAGIALGVMALIIVTSVMGGFSREVRNRIRGTASHLSVTNPSGYFIRDYEEVMADIRKIPEVEDCAPRLEWAALVGQPPQQMQFVQIIGIRPESEKKVSDFEKYLLNKTPTDFRTDEDNESTGVIIGSQLFGIPPYHDKQAPFPGGRSVSLTSAKFTLGLPMPVRRDFPIVGVFNTGMVEYDSNIYMALATAQGFVGAPEAITKIAIRLKDYRTAPRVVQELNRRLPYSLMVQTWEDEKRNLLRAVAVEKNINAIILFFIIIVASFNILSMLTMRVVEKTHDIGILKSMGATTGGIAQLFLYQGLLIALVGCFIGVTGGYLLASNLDQVAGLLYRLFGFEVFPKDIYMLDSIPSEIDPLTIAVVVSATVFVSIVFSIYPASKAAKLQSVEALKYE